jgi:hypothetical protein
VADCKARRLDPFAGLAIQIFAGEFNQDYSTSYGQFVFENPNLVYSGVHRKWIEVLVEVLRTIFSIHLRKRYGTRFFAQGVVVPGTKY